MQPRKYRILGTLVLLTMGSVTGAEAQICVNGQASTSVWTGALNSTQAYRLIGDAYACQKDLVFTDTVSSTLRHDFGDPTQSLLQAADASIFAYAAFGGLRASVNAKTAVGNTINSVTSAGGQLEETWNDVITFHTGNPSGADFRFTITLADGLGSTLIQGPGYARNSSASAQAVTYLFLGGGGDPLLSVVDAQSVYVPGGGNGTPVLMSDSNHPAARTVSTVVHVYDGQQFNIAQTLRIQAGVNGPGVAFADAADTAFFNLSSTDPLASYLAASGTVFLASGDPFAPAVPEPADWELLAAGIGVLGWASKRRNAKR